MANLVKEVVDLSQAQPTKSIQVPSTDRIEHFHRMIMSAQTRELDGAATILRERLVNALVDMQREVDEAIYLASSSVESSNEVSAADIMADLGMLETEFAGCEFGFKKQTITVTTESIELESVYLGAFEIELELKCIGQSNPYRVIATDPNPATDCDSTTHPHVQSETLCEGEGSVPIKRALAEGRLHDFFTIVNQILRTYNSLSAYTTLREWSGTECRDCGCRVDDDEVTSCTRCEGQLCDECSCSCEGCCDRHCDNCITTCEGCECSFCRSCSKSCDRCDKPFCEDCLTENKCDDCTEEEKEKEETLPQAANATSDASVQSVRVGEIAVST
jgi:hypothetical protein